VDELLFLCHRLPYPPNKGDKIRSFHLLRHLAKRYRVHLGTFIDDPGDWRYLADVGEFCEQTCILPLRRWQAMFRCLAGLATHQPLSVSYYRDQRLQRWVDERLQHGSVRKAVVFSSAMAGYLTNRLGGEMHSLIDFVDVDSEKWAQYGSHARWPLNWIYRREADRLLAHDEDAALGFDASVFVSRQEAQLFKRLVPQAASRTDYVENGVDAEYFSPERDYPNPYPSGVLPVTFTGAMDYRPNVDAVEWFVHEVLPLVAGHFPQVAFFIVGTRPGERVRRLARLDRVTVTGGVPETRPYLAHARAAVAPLRIARGIQNKVLEALAMGIPVVATPAAVEGIADGAGQALQVAEAPLEFGQAVIRLLSGLIPGTATTGARNWIVERYNWDGRLAAVDRLLDAVPEVDIEQVCPERPLDGACQY